MINLTRTQIHTLLTISIIFLTITLLFVVLFGRVHSYAFWMGGIITALLVHYWKRPVGRRVRRSALQFQRVAQDLLTKVMAKEQK